MTTYGFSFVIRFATLSGNYYAAKIAMNGDVIENYGRFESRERAEAQLKAICGCTMGYSFQEVDGF